jgi:type II secretory pathway component PulF
LTLRDAGWLFFGLVAAIAIVSFWIARERWIRRRRKR